MLYEYNARDPDAATNDTSPSVKSELLGGLWDHSPRVWRRTEWNAIFGLRGLASTDPQARDLDALRYITVGIDAARHVIHRGCARERV